MLTAARAPELVRNMLLLSNSLNGVLWSLQVEVIASFALFAVWGLAGGSRWKLVLSLIIAVAGVPFFRGEIVVPFFPAFLLGGLISSVDQRVWHLRWLVGSGIVILVFTNVVLGHSSITRMFEIAGATILVGAVARGKFSVLRTRVPLFLGAISYPFYLTHVVGLIVAERYIAALPPMSPLVLISAYAVVSIAVTIPMAWLLHVFVEEPVLRARPRIGQWWPARRR